MTALCPRSRGEPCCVPEPKADSEPTKTSPGYHVLYNNTLGRHLVAAKDFAPGDLVFVDPPLVVGPQFGSRPICLTCYRPVDGRFCCSECGWPLCSEDCALSPQHQPECEATARTGSAVRVTRFDEANSLYNCIMIVRCIMLKCRNPQKWSQLMSMEANSDKKRETLLDDRSRLLAELVEARFRMSDFATHEEMLNVTKILDVNAYEIRMPATNIQGVYPIACLPEHNCVPNTFRCFRRDLSLIVRAAVPIRKGEHITVTYTDTLWSTPDRRSHLLFSKYFWCCCDRCKSPTELGSYIGAAACPVCAEDNIQPGNLLPVIDKDEDDDDPFLGQPDMYRCDQCEAEAEVEAVQTAADQAAISVRELDEADGRPHHYESLLSSYDDILHPHHAALLDIKHTLLHLYGPRLSALPEADVRRKLELGREILEVASLVFPGISQLKGTTHFEVASALLELAHRSSDPKETAELLKEARSNLMETVMHLRFQPEGQPEQMTTERAHNEIHRLDERLTSLKVTI